MTSLFEEFQRYPVCVCVCMYACLYVCVHRRTWVAAYAHNKMCPTLYNPMDMICFVKSVALFNDTFHHCITPIH